MNGPAAAGRPAVFLDRDGVIVELVRRGKELTPPRALSEVVIARDAGTALADLDEAGFALVVVSNQPDVARGDVEEATVLRIHARLMEELPIDEILFCPHDNRDGCDCRKPRPGLLLRAARELRLDLARSWMIGDRWVDLEAAAAAGVRPVLLERHYSWDPTSSGAPGRTRPVFAGHSLSECAAHVLSADDGGTP